MQRRLAAILVADVVGYSRLMEADEAGTLAALKARRKEIVEPLVKEHGGRVVKFMGDGVLVEFGSAVNAATCALAMQERMATANADGPAAKRILLRIGINLGDVVGEGSDIFGDGVNVAARLETLAEPGGICISAAVREAVQGKVHVSVEDLGDLHLKSISRPVRAWKIKPPEAVVGTSQRSGVLAEKPTIAVLPFLNMSGDSEQDYFADGLTEDLITALSYSSNWLVISRTSVFAFKGKSIDVRCIARELGADYVLEGSVRKGGAIVRVTAQLIETRTGHHVWAEKFDGPLESIFAIQDQITRAVAASTSTRVFLTSWKSRRLAPEAHTTASELARAAIGRVYESSAEASLEGWELANAALKEDPSSPLAHLARATAFLNCIAYACFPQNEANAALAIQYSTKALQLAPQDDNAIWIMAWALANAGHLEQAVAEAERGLTINPNSTLLIADLGSFLARLGRPEEAIPKIELALRLDPKDPVNHWRFDALARSHFILDEYAKARNEARKAALASPGFTRAGLIWAASAAALGDADGARVAIAHCRSERPDVTLSNAFPIYMPPFARKAHQDKLVILLRQAGLPE